METFASLRKSNSAKNLKREKSIKDMHNARQKISLKAMVQALQELLVERTCPVHNKALESMYEYFQFELNTSYSKHSQ